MWARTSGAMPEPDPAVADDRVARVDHEVDDDLLELRAVDQDVGDVVADLGDQLDAIAEGAAHHALEAADPGGGVDPARRDDLAAAEHQQLAGQLARAGGGAR